MTEKLQKIRNALYQINATNISLYMIGMKKRDDKIVEDTNACIAEVIRMMDEAIDGDDHEQDEYSHCSMCGCKIDDPTYSQATVNGKEYCGEYNSGCKYKAVAQSCK